MGLTSHPHPGVDPSPHRGDQIDEIHLHPHLKPALSNTPDPISATSGLNTARKPKRGSRAPKVLTEVSHRCSCLGSAEETEATKGLAKQDDPNESGPDRLLARAVHHTVVL